MTSMPAVDRPPPIERAWQALADGMHIHRWFLCVEPHLLRLRAEAVVPAGEQISLCGRHVRVTADASGQAAAAAARHAGKLVERSGLGYLVELGLAEIVVTGSPSPAGPLVIVVAPTRCPLSLAAGLLGQTAAGWLRLFALLDRSPHPGEALRRWHETDTAEAEQYLDLAVRIRLFESALAEDERPVCIHVDANRARMTLDSMRKQAAAELALAYAVARSLPLCARDLLISQFPGPMRFAKYQEGGGVGQG